jgi:hypothetical protein
MILRIQPCTPTEGSGHGDADVLRRLVVRFVDERVDQFC